MIFPRPVARLISVFALSIVPCLSCLAQTAIPDEFQVRAAIVANLVRFVTWAPGKGSPHSPIIVGLLGFDQQSAALEVYLSNHPIDGRTFQIHKLGRLDRADDCQILYVAPAEQRRFEELATSLSQSGVLTISDDPSFALAGGVVGLPVVGDRIEIQINLLRAQQSGIAISSRLLGLARVLRKADRK